MTLLFVACHRSLSRLNLLLLSVLFVCFVVRLSAPRPSLLARPPAGVPILAPGHRAGQLDRSGVKRRQAVQRLVHRADMLGRAAAARADDRRAESLHAP